MRARVRVYPRKEVLDPQGKAVADALRRVGFETVKEVRVGKSFEIELADEAAGTPSELLDAMCRKLLANTVVEDFEIELLGGDEETAR